MDHRTSEIKNLFLTAHQAWSSGDFDHLIAMMHEDILYIVNVDGQQVPYAMSAVGRNDLRDRLELLLHTFHVTHFELKSMIAERDHITSLVHGIYHHKKTGEILDINVRFRGWYEPSGLITRIEEIHDARYIEAFERFVFFLENAQNS